RTCWFLLVVPWEALARANRCPPLPPSFPFTVCCLVWGARINSEESEGEAPCALRYIAIPSISKATSPSSSCVCLSISLRLLLF
ncbi:mCG1041507, isoform CRA_a, partial [Mus musculus]